MDIASLHRSRALCDDSTALKIIASSIVATDMSTGASPRPRPGYLTGLGMLKNYSE
ncbi:hypothetical protein V1279_002754 [Bradyrhizobium sp. AZCC 1610]|uniref:hypothetical protein n=1 Tax=Bradyrhizobium sp. AZCC 1610 TaxID=3117020 RepID=UPI002FF0C921